MTAIDRIATVATEHGWQITAPENDWERYVYERRNGREVEQRPRQRTARYRMVQSAGSCSSQSAVGRPLEPIPAQENPMAYTLGQRVPFDGTTWRVISTRGIPGATQVVGLRDTADGRHCQTWTASILDDMIRRGWGGLAARPNGAELIIRIEEAAGPTP